MGQIDTDTPKADTFPDDWRIVRVEDVVQRVKQINPKKTPNLSFKYIDVSSISSDTLAIENFSTYIGNNAPSRARKVINKGDVIFATIRPNLKRIAKVTENFDGEICSTAFCVIRADQKILDPDFLYFAVCYNPFVQRVSEHQRGSSYPAVSDKNILTEWIPLPPLYEQRVIAQLLLTVQQAKEATEKVIAAARQLKQSLMRHLFTYGPVPFPEADQVELQETEIGMRPRSWRAIKIGDVARVQGGFAFRSKDYIKDGLRLLRISNVSFGLVVWHDAAYLPPEYIDIYKDYSLRPGDLVMAITRPVVSEGIKVARLKIEDTPALLNQRVCRFLPTGEIDLEFLFQMLFDKGFVEAISGGAIGSQQPNISTGKVEGILIPQPPLDEQRYIAQSLKAVDSKINNEHKRFAALELIFATLLHNLMTGQIRVHDLDLPAMEEVA